MDQLEDSTLDLIFRRRVRSYYPGYVIIIMITGLVLVLPLIKVDVVTSVRGMIRPLEEPVEVGSAITGILDSTIVKNNIQVMAGDTLAWIRRDPQEVQIKSYERIIHTNQGSIHDILTILEGNPPSFTSRYQQSYNNHRSALSLLQLQEKFLHGEFTIAEKLYGEEVISMHDYEKARSNYQIICARISETQESYRNKLEEELYLLKMENKRMQGEIELINSTSQEYFVVAPVTGTVHDCPGITSGSVIHAGTSIGIISPSGRLVAECYLQPFSIPAVKIGTRVKLRFDHPGFHSLSTLETVVDYIDKDVTLVKGNPAYRIRCSLDNPQIRYTDGRIDPVQKGMTFTANIILFRQSLATLILENLNRWINPAESVGNG
jgi:multidrug resistance efflux pump